MPDIIPARAGYCVTLDAFLREMAMRVHLFTNDPPLNQDTAAGDFVEPVFVGYEPIVVTRWTPSVLREGRAWAASDPLYWSYTDGTPPDPVRGVFVVDNVTGLLLGAWKRPGAGFALGPDAPLLTVLLSVRHPSPSGAFEFGTGMVLLSK